MTGKRSKRLPAKAKTRIGKCIMNAIRKKDNKQRIYNPLHKREKAETRPFSYRPMTDHEIEQMAKWADDSAWGELVSGSDSLEHGWLV
jgi:hypothetical protein